MKPTAEYIALMLGELAPLTLSRMDVLNFLSYILIKADGEQALREVAAFTHTDRSKHIPPSTADERK
jgi:hypothetical protein